MKNEIWKYDLPGETWKDIPEFSRYQVSNKGRIRALPGAKLGGKLTAKQIVLRGQYLLDSRGYMYVRLEQSKIPVHIVVLNTFFGPCPPGKECRHLNGNPSNNCLENLEWGTPKENGQDKVRHGTSARGERNGRSKLTDTQVSDIRSRAQYHGITVKLGEEFGVSPQMIWNIRKGLSWSQNG